MNCRRGRGRGCRCGCWVLSAGGAGVKKVLAVSLLVPIVFFWFFFSSTENSLASIASPLLSAFAWGGVQLAHAWPMPSY